MKRIISFLLSLSVVLLSILTLFGCEGRVITRKEFYSGYFDTVCEFRDVSGAGENSFKKRATLVEAELSLCHKLFDIYNEYSGIINLKTINDNAGNGEWLSVDERIIELLLLSKEMYDKTDGNINIAMGNVTAIWKSVLSAFDNLKPVVIPTDEQLLSAAEHTSISALEIDEAGGRVRLNDENIRLDVGAIAKGYTADRVGRLTRDETKYFLLDFGGNLVIGEKRGGKTTRIAIRTPYESDEAYVRILDLKNTAFVTSGVDQRGFTLDGVRYHHIINAKTLRPENNYYSVSVLYSSSAVADALSTALFNMTIEEGREVIRAFPGIEITYVLNDKSVEIISG